MAEAKKKRTNWKKKFQDLEKDYEVLREDYHVSKVKSKELQEEIENQDGVINSQRARLDSIKQQTNFAAKLLTTIQSRESWNPFKTVKIYREECNFICKKLKNL